MPPTSLVYGGGPLIDNVQVEPIFEQDALTGNEAPASEQAELEAYFQDITSNSYIPTLIGKEYSVPGYTIGNGTVGTADTNVQITPSQLDYSGTIARSPTTKLKP